MMSPSLFAHIQNDAELSGTHGLEAHNFTNTIRYLKNYLQHLKTNEKKYPEAYLTILDEMEYLIAIQEHLDNLLSPFMPNFIYSLDELKEKITNDILQMSVDEKIPLPGGWHNVRGGHGMVYEFVRKEEEYIFRVINAGAGLEYHPKKSSPEKELYNPLKSWSFPLPKDSREKTELGFFIERLLIAKLPNLRKKETGAEIELGLLIDASTLYEKIFPSISYFNGKEMEEDIIPDFAYTGGQPTGTCAQSCLNQKLKLGSSSAYSYLYFMLEYKLYTLFNYAEDCFSGKFPLTEAARNQINLAIENNLKILKTLNPADESLKKEYFEKIRKLQKNLKGKQITSPKKQPVWGDDSEPGLSIVRSFNSAAKPKLYARENNEILTYQIDLASGDNLLQNLQLIVATIEKISDKGIQFYYIEKLIFSLPFNDDDGLVSPFYKEIRGENHTLFAKEIGKIIQILRNVAREWKLTPVIVHLFLFIMLLQMDNAHTQNQAKKYPTFLPFVKALLRITLDTNSHNPFWATQNPLYEDRLKFLKRRVHNAVKKVENSEWINYFNDLLKTEPKLYEELLDLYVSRHGKKTKAPHPEILRNKAEVLYMIVQYLSVKIPISDWLPAKFQPLVQKIQEHLDNEYLLASAFNPLLYWTIHSNSIYFHGSGDLLTPLGRITLHFNDLSQKRFIKEPQYRALLKDNCLRLPKQAQYTANYIQLNETIARDYFHLRSVPALQIRLTINYYTRKRNLKSLADEANQIYLEMNLFQPGLLEQALDNPLFLSEFDRLLTAGYRYFNHDKRQASLIFLRLDYLVSRYIYLKDKSTGLARFQHFQEQLLKQLSIPETPEIRYFQQECLFLTLLTRIELGEEVLNDFLHLAYKSFHHIQNHSNPKMVNSPGHTVEVFKAIAKFQILLSTLPQEKIKKIVEKILVEELKTKEITLIGGKFPIYRFQKDNQRLEFHVLLGKVFKNGLVYSNVSPFIKDHDLIQHLNLDLEEHGYCSPDNNYHVLFDKSGNEIRYHMIDEKKFIQKTWSINGQTQFYELKALTKNHITCLFDQRYSIISSLPQVLSDNTIDYWQDVSDSSQGILVQKNNPIFRVSSGTIIALDEKGYDTGYKLKALDQKWLSLLSHFESKQFILPLKKETSIWIKLPRYGIHFEVIQEKQKTFLVHQETGGQVIDVPSPIHPAVAGLVLKKEKQMHYLVPIAQFFATPKNVEKGDFYPVIHDTQDVIARNWVEETFSHNLRGSLPRKIVGLIYRKEMVYWNYQDNQKSMLFSLQEGVPIANTVAEALYLTYIYLATTQTEKAWQTLEACQKRLGGLTGDPQELQFIVWICEAMPYILLDKENEFIYAKIKQRKTPTYVACQLKALSLLTDYLLQNRQITLEPLREIKSQYDTFLYEESYYQNYRINGYTQLSDFLNSLPITVGFLFNRLQAMRRHLKYTYTLSPIECKSLLDYYHDDKKKRVGSLGYEHRRLHLSLLNQEKNALLARAKGTGTLSQADKKRLDLITDQLKQSQSVFANSSSFKKVKIPVKLPKESAYYENVHNRGQWSRLTFKKDFNRCDYQKAMESLSSKISDQAFWHNFPIYLHLVTFSSDDSDDIALAQLKQFCEQTIITHQHAHNPIPLRLYLCNLIYYLLHNPELVKQVKKSLSDKIDIPDIINAIKKESHRSPLPPLEIFKPKDVHKKPMDEPDDILDQEVLTPRPLTNPANDMPGMSLYEQLGIPDQLSTQFNDELKELLEQYKNLASKANKQIKQLGKELKLTHDLSEQFTIEKKAGAILFKLEEEQRGLAQNLLNNPNLLTSLLNAVKTQQPSLEDQAKTSWDKALELANKGPASPEEAWHWKVEKKAKARAKIDEAQLLSLYCHADVNYSLEKTGLSFEEVKDLHNLIHTALLASIRSQTASRIRVSLGKKKTDVIAVQQTLDVLAKDAIPYLNTPATVIIQYAKNILLRDRQVEVFKKFLHSQETTDSIEKIAPGIGKSTVILIVLAEQMAKGHNLVVIEVPAALLPTNHIDFNAASQQLFGKRAYRFEFERNSDTSAKNLRRLYYYFVEVITTHSYLVTAEESTKSLMLSYLELLLNPPVHFKPSSEKDKDRDKPVPEEVATKEWENKVFWLDKIRTLFRDYTNCIMDEVHQGLWIKKKLNYTIGKPETADIELIRLALALFKYVDTDFIRQASCFDTDYDWTPFKTTIASKLIKDPASPLREWVKMAKLHYGEDLEEKLIAYLLNQGEMLEAVLHAPLSEKRALGFFKGQINRVLPSTLNRTLDVHYGPSKIENLSPHQYAIAIPYAGNNAPKEKSRFTWDETIDLTIIMMILKGCNKDLFENQINIWQTLARQELFQYPQYKHLDDTPTGKKFAAMDPNTNLTLSQINLKDSDSNLEVFYLKYRYNRNIMNDLLEEQVLKHIPQNTRILSANSFNHVDQFSTFLGVSGTPNPTTLHSRLSYNPTLSLGSDGYFLEILEHKKTPISFLDYQTLPKFVETLMQQSIYPQNTRVIIDIMPFFSGISNLNVAKEIALYINKNQSQFSCPIMYLLYNNENQILCALDIRNPEKSIILGSSDEKHIRRTLGVKPRQRFTYYDELHTQGMDIVQDEHAHALVTVGKNITLQDYEQGGLRMRLFSQKQTMQLIAPSNLLGISRESLENDLARDEQQQLLVDGYFAAIGNMYNYLQQKALSYIDAIPSDHAFLKAEKAQQFEDFLTEAPSQDFFARDGIIEIPHPTLYSLQAKKNHLLEQWKKAHKKANCPLSEDEFKLLDKTLEEIIKQAIPNCVKEYLGSTELLSMQVEIEVENEKEIELENMKEHQLEQQIETNKKRNEIAYKKWSALFKGNTNHKALSVDVNRICGIANTKQFLFSSALRASENYYRVYSEQQQWPDDFLKPVFLVWYYYDNNTLKAMIITQQEAEELSPYLTKNKNKGWIATTLDSVIAGTATDGCLVREDYQALREQVRFFHGEFELLIDQNTPLIWLKERPIEKMNFFENALNAYRSCEPDKFMILKAALNQENTRGLDHIADHPFEDFRHYDWTYLFPGIIPCQASEYTKLAEVFAYVNHNWLEQTLSLADIQKYFNLPPRYLEYVEPHLELLLSIKKLLHHLAYQNDQPFSNEEEPCFKACVGLSSKGLFQKFSLEDRALAPIEALRCIKMHPALKRQSLQAYLLPLIPQQLEARCKFWARFDKSILADLPLKDYIETANEKELPYLLDIEKTGPLNEELLLLLLNKCRNEEHMDSFLKRTDLTENLFKAVLKKKELSGTQVENIIERSQENIASLLDRKPPPSKKELRKILDKPAALNKTLLIKIYNLDNKLVTDKLLVECNFDLLNIAMETSIFEKRTFLRMMTKLALNDKQEQHLIKKLLSRKDLSPDELERILNKIPKYKNLHRALTHSCFEEAKCKQWFENLKTSKMQDCTLPMPLQEHLQCLKIKACEHAINALTDDNYKDSAPIMIELYRTISKELSHYAQDPQGCLDNCKLALSKAKPALQEPRGGIKKIASETFSNAITLFKLQPDFSPTFSNASLDIIENIEKAIKAIPIHSRVGLNDEK